MKKYRLETVIGIRQRAKEAATQNVAAALQRLALAEEELTRRQRLLSDCFGEQQTAREKFERDAASGIAVGGLLAQKNWLAELRRREDELRTLIDEQKETVRHAERDLETARLKLAESARDLTAIETHKENWQTVERRAEQKKEAKFTDEIAGILHSRKPKSGD